MGKYMTTYKASIDGFHHVGFGCGFMVCNLKIVDHNSDSKLIDFPPETCIIIFRETGCQPMGPCSTYVSDHSYYLFSGTGISIPIIHYIHRYVSLKTFCSRNTVNI